MASFDAVNYSLRPNKTIQRGLVFDGLKALGGHLNWPSAAYIGFGSIWFTDFVIAHKRLGINKMLSIECDEIGFQRAAYNRPFRSVEVIEGYSYNIIPTFYDDPEMMSRPWLIWMDYDSGLSDESVSELRGLIERAPPDSVLLTTIDASAKHYGITPEQKTGRLRTLLGDVVPTKIPRDQLTEPDVFASTIARLLEGFFIAVAENCARPGGIIPGFRLPYRDKAAMVTVGGILPSPAKRQIITDLVHSTDWTGIADVPIVAPHLTLRELAVLQSQMPDVAELDRSAVRALGFDLGDDQITVFRKYYKYYPTFAQISA